ncbi:SMC family ATPase [Algoriphagus halophytocola]|uniref:SMC family ATPase n=1 Tax=Algoriphagus halophytocola TaxID=2991499 RepID=A0ABY6MIS5_9BACT|nr:MULTISPECIES: SMC family ATPase [unclassified Algoriphagus]UZD22181.1 SMC family ATPase [Algoriphagus sp. TR-M5]WBL43432.1 SMC family ATPase [Algoriphagus sp. TR-M9]
MIPIRLDIQGLYSYKEKQTIEFDKLTAAGLFGIFGAVGSGKSSILEAILLALYGSTERLSDRGEKNSMVNLQSDLLLLNFEFSSGRNNAKTYLARYSAKRNSKNFDDIKPAERSFYEKVDGNWEPISSSAEEIIGMKKEHFKQTVIIPQGKFREFIDQKPLDQAKMMKELFGLERFDLQDKTRTLLKTVKEQKIRLETQSQGLEEFSEQLLTEKQSQFKELKKQATEASQKLKTAEAKLRLQEDLRSKNLQLLKFRKERESLNLQRPEIEKQRQLHSEFIKAKTHLRPVWEQIRDTKAELEKYKVSVIDCERFKIELAKVVADLEKEEVELKKKNQERPHREAKIRDLKKVIEIQNLETQRVVANDKLQDLQPTIERRKQTQKTLEAKIAELETEAEKISSTDSSFLANLLSWAKDWKNLENQLDKLQAEETEITTEVERINQKLETLQSTIPANLGSLENWESTQKSAIQELEKQRDGVIQKQGLAAHVHLLHQGEPCPLCGAMDHPNPLEGDGAVDLGEITQQIKSAKLLLEQIQTSKSTQSELRFHLENHQKNSAAKKKDLQQLRENLSSIKTTLAKEGIGSHAELLTKIQAIEHSSQSREKLIQEVKTLRKNWDAERVSIEKSEKELQQAQLKLQSVLSSISAKKEEIRDMAFCKQFFTKESSQIQAAIDKVEKDIEEALQSLEGKQKHLREKRSVSDKNLADLANFTQLRDQRTEKLELLSLKYNELKVQHGFLDEERLIQLFQHSIDAEKVAKDIADFDRKYDIAENRIQELEAEAGVADFLEQAFQELFSSFENLKINAETCQNQVLLLDQEIQEAISKLAEKKNIQANFAKLETRESYLKELDNLFRGSGFVKFVSSIYLKELCNTANVRFMKLCKNRLSLEIDDNNTFWVIDYLNGGKKRLLKTLSGGQTFQASLCLALALAEKVKALNQADQSFFFMDEGFGALDKNALRVVFETLKSLRHENRIVGIISHVEDLQQEIGVFANVELDPELGSQVSYSF